MLATLFRSITLESDIKLKLEVLLFSSAKSSACSSTTLLKRYTLPPLQHNYIFVVIE